LEGLTPPRCIRSISLFFSPFFLSRFPFSPSLSFFLDVLLLVTDKLRWPLQALGLLLLPFLPFFSFLTLFPFSLAEHEVQSSGSQQKTRTTEEITKSQRFPPFSFFFSPSESPSFFSSPPFSFSCALSIRDKRIRGRWVTRSKNHFPPFSPFFFSSFFFSPLFLSSSIVFVAATRGRSRRAEGSFICGYFFFFFFRRSFFFLFFLFFSRIGLVVEGRKCQRRRAGSPRCSCFFFSFSSFLRFFFPPLHSLWVRRRQGAGISIGSPCFFPFFPFFLREGFFLSFLPFPSSPGGLGRRHCSRGQAAVP